MYLRKVLILNIGPLRDLSLSPKFNDQGDPLPMVLVGGNGSGKTTYLSIVADAFVELAKKAFIDVVPGQGSFNTPYFRIVGGSSRALGTDSSLALLTFDDDGTAISYCEKSGNLDQADLTDRIGHDFPGLSWPTEGDHKVVTGTDETLKSIFLNGAYAFFPSSRAEIPHWLNLDSLDRKPQFKFSLRFSQNLSKPIFVERGLESLKPWLLDVIVDSRFDSILLYKENDIDVLRRQAIGAIIHAKTLTNINQILKTIILDSEVRLGYLNRSFGANRLCIVRGDDLIIPSLDHLSSGQATLFSTFATIMRYGEGRNISQSTNLGNIPGIVVIDEVDAHLHTELQYTALPQLIQLFPKIQFIVTSHSPLLVLGMQKTFGEDGVQIIELPHGQTIDTERFSEFERSFAYYRETRSFDDAITNAVTDGSQPLILTEGETDAKYLKTAMELRGFREFLDGIDVEWVGAKSDAAPQLFNTGHSGLNHTRNVLVANPGLMRKKVVLLYDFDVNKPNEDIGLVSVRSQPFNPENTKVTKGIENLFPAPLFEDEYYETREQPREDGGKTVHSHLKKVEFCDWVCVERRDPDDFEKFDPLINELQTMLGTEEIGDQEGE